MFFVLNFLFHSPSPSPTTAPQIRRVVSCLLGDPTWVQDQWWGLCKAAERPFFGLYHDSEGHNMLKSQEAMCGRVLSQWWDGSGAAGPRSRPTVPFGEAPPDLEVLALHQNELKCLAWCKLTKCSYMFHLSCPFLQVCPSFKQDQYLQQIYTIIHIQ